MVKYSKVRKRRKIMEKSVRSWTESIGKSPVYGWEASYIAHPPQWPVINSRRWLLLTKFHATANRRSRKMEQWQPLTGSGCSRVCNSWLFLAALLLVLFVFECGCLMVSWWPSQSSRMERHPAPMDVCWTGNGMECLEGELHGRSPNDSNMHISIYLDLKPNIPRSQSRLNYWQTQLLQFLNNPWAINIQLFNVAKGNSK